MDRVPGDRSINGYAEMVSQSARNAAIVRDSRRVCTCQVDFLQGRLWRGDCFSTVGVPLAETRLVCRDVAPLPPWASAGYSVSLVLRRVTVIASVSLALAIWPP